MGRTLSDANIIIGGLLIFWAGLAELYMTVVHDAPAGCGRASDIVINDACYLTWPYLLAPAVLGIILLLLGAFSRPPYAVTQDLLRTDPYTTMVLACFLSVALVTGIAALVLWIQEAVSGTDPGTWDIRNIAYGRLNILGTAAIMAAITFFVGFGVNMSHLTKRRRFISGLNRARARKGL